MLAIALCACGPAIEGPPTTTTATATTATPALGAPGAALPADFPAVGAAPATGTLAGKPFAIATGHVRTSGGFAALDLYSWRGADDPCEPQFAPEPDQLYVSVQFHEDRLQPGGAVAHGENDTLVTYKKPDLDPIDRVAHVVFDAVTDTRAAGRLELTAPGQTRVLGAFDVPVCRGAQRAATGLPSANGVTWGERPEQLPAEPVEGVLLGKPGAPVAVEAVDWSDGEFAQHEVHFYYTAPGAPCGFDQMSPGFKIGFPSTLTAGLSARTDVKTVTRTGSPFGVVLWNEPGNVLGMEGAGWVSAQIDAVTDDQVRGRVVAWFEDASKSMVAGAFTARRCKGLP